MLTKHCCGEPSRNLKLPAGLDSRDTVHNAAYRGLAWLSRDRFNEARKITRPVLEILWTVFWPRKNPTYFWGNSEGLTRWLADHFPPLRKIPKGLNGDQCFPMLIFLALTKDYRFTNRYIVGMILRSIVLLCVPASIAMIAWGLDWWWFLPGIVVFPWYPNGEPLLSRPHHLAPVARLYRLRPLYLILDIFALVSLAIALKKPISEETTNKIKFFPYLWQAEDQPTPFTRWMKRLIMKTEDYRLYGNMYFEAVYSEYFKFDLTASTMAYIKVPLIQR